MRLPQRSELAFAMVVVAAAAVVCGQTPAGPSASSPSTPPEAAPSGSVNPASAAGASSDFRPQTPEERDAAQFLELDSNQDGWLSGSEATGIRHYDSNADGEINQDEFIAGRAVERILLRQGTVLPEDIDLFTALDSTGSGYISGVDIERGGVADYDVDGNGRVTRQEFYDGRARMRREMEERAKAAREAETRRRLAAGEPEPPPPLDEELQPKRGMMRGRVLLPDGKPVSQFTVEIVAYNIDQNNPRIDGRAMGEPNFIGRHTGRDGYYEIRLPDGSFGFAATVTIPTESGPKRYPLRTAGERQTIDYIEIERSGEGVVKNLIWDPASSEIKPHSSP